MSVNITLNFIRENWSSATRAMDRRGFCTAVLPDAYDRSRCANQGAHFFDPDALGGLSDQTVNGLMRGNRKSASNLAFASAAFTKDLLGKLQSNAPVTYLDPQRAGTTCVENMWAKIRALVRYHGTPRTKDHPLFARMDFSTLGDCDEITRKAYRKMRMAIDSLLERETETKSPQVQRVAIVARELGDEELPYIRGLLRTGGKQVLMTPRQLEIFLEEFQDYPWMADFRKNYLPIFATHQRTFYCFYEDELLSCSASDLPYEDRLRILLALKSVDPPNDKTLQKFTRASVPSKTHTILK